jgi:phytoene synthase
VVYAFCRFVDDTADEATDQEHARVQLGLIRDELRGVLPASPLIGAFLDVARRTGMNLRYADELIEGVISDLGTVSFQDDAELLRYCYRVAGTVGLMMCPILGVRDRNALAHAIDLGVAMQLTNICRDVKEDAGRHRVYLPASRLAQVGLSTQDVLAGECDRDALSSVVRDLLDLAERYYQSGEVGMRYIPARSRYAILVAARLYRAIGLKLLERGADPMKGRAWVGWPGKTYWLLRSTVAFLNGHRTSDPHDRRLHSSLVGLPDTNV